MNGFVLVAIGGGIGAALRYGVSLAALRLGPASTFPIGTLSVNLIGSFLMGVVIGTIALRDAGASQNLRLFLATGILGGFTTFSAFSLEVANMLREDAFVRAGLYVGLSVIVGVAALLAGLFLARRVLV